MNKRIDFSKLEGIATYQDTLAFLQDSYRGAFAGIAASFGNHVIISGVVDLGANWGDGWVVIDGELMPFAGGLKAAQVIVEELTDTEVFGDDSIQTVYFTKRAKCASAGGTDMTSFVRLSTFADISTGLANLITTVAGLAVVPTGTICMWSGTVAPAGWGLCDGGGSPARPDLRGKFIVGLNTGDADYNAIGKTGGEKKHTLSEGELPSHHHTYVDRYYPENNPSLTSYPDGREYMGASQTGSGDTDGDNTYVLYKNENTGNTGSGLSHENRPPYYALAYIVKL